MIRNEATQNQVNAAEPNHTTWLSANAGSGKTRVLTDRVARLLLSGVEPQNILCLTYTKAAAAEMQNRLFKLLGEWAMRADDALFADLKELGVDGTPNLQEARTLFARAIETPGGLKIQTIHSFCASILRRFPLEAGISPQFKEMEDRTAELLRSDVLDAMVTGPHADVVRDLMMYHTGAELDKLVAEVARHRDHFAQGFDEAELRKMLGLASSVETADLMANIFGPAEIAVLREVVTLCRDGSSNDVKAAEKLATIDLENPKPADLETLEDVLLFKSSKISGDFSPKIDSFPTKPTRAKNSDLFSELNFIMETVAASRQDRLALIALERTKALYAFGRVFVPAYEARKLEMGLLDFDDQIRKARALLTDPHVAQWVLFRLDGGIDHVLVDEAQDTSPDQWAVIKHLTQEFVSGEGARANQRRTIFVVGDKKQSIYSFQGADPDEFDRMQRHFETKLKEANDQLHNLTLQHSFRSSQAVLRVVDAALDGETIEGLGGEVQHSAFNEDMPGRVDLWPVIENNPAAEDDRVWYDPVDKKSEQHHTVILANQIAAEIKRMTQEETLPVDAKDGKPAARRLVTEGDVLILVQRRSDLFSEIIRACKAADLSIAGADRLRVGAEMAVKDLAALLSFLALPEDDLSLATALRSPLFGWSEQDLFTLAHYRPEKGYLWATLRNSDAHPNTFRILNDLRGKSDFLRPYDLIERILTVHEGRKKLLARLGAEAEDGIDALLSQALAYESNGVPSLTGFLTWMQTDDLEIKRQMDNQGNRIRVMTVHGAKGLEAPIVILPDTAKREPRNQSEIFDLGDHLIWPPTKPQSSDSVNAMRDDIRAREMRERMRLLYVAMTRAEKWLIVAAAGDVGEQTESWYRIAEAGIETSGAIDAQSGDIQIRRVTHGDWSAGELLATDKTETLKPSAPIFTALPEIRPQKTLSPSDLGGDKIMAGDPAGEDRDVALERGRLVHLLLEHLPQVPVDERGSLGLQLITASPDFAPDAEELVRDVINLLVKDELTFLFGPETLSEIGITASLPALGGKRIHGAIDLLQIHDDRILAVDFKTNRLVPPTPEETPEGLLRQMGAYAAALAEIYPNHKIETAILWTQTGTLMRLPAPLVSDALARVSVA
ncbi:DNA helicase/exodeoxyribonuclease V, subunit A [Cognatiyoonia koreensis]|uniref:DNA 3'-5' helicase n=1 Tax=Cognatiyoonia koreensis TaxID=364200 RepID=A0A1I0RQ15_9RHOB|nr:double-strand break repair helicase AddA [Cognatiyoonia koreensis]SEW43316.1 DNA helicase/exodeoxyribonuclease V, subunit A [Cognatiyoonia koreensis]